MVTFTKSAAQEMRERISNRLYEEVSKKPELYKQLKLVSKANITTIDSFCLSIVKDNFFKVDLDPNFRIGENSELELLKQEALEELLEEKYENGDETLANVLNMYISNKDDDNLRKLILKIYDFTSCCPDPNKWLEEKVEEFCTDEYDDADKYISTTLSAITILDYSKQKIKSAIIDLEDLLKDIEDNDLAGKYIDVINDDINSLKDLLYKATSWDSMYNALKSFEFARASGAKGVPDNLKEMINRC